QVEIEALRSELRAIARLCEQAATTRTLAPRSPLRYQARVVGAMADIAWLRVLPEPDPGQMNRLRDNLRTLAVSRKPYPEDRDSGLRLLFMLLMAPPTPAQQAEWRLDEPANEPRYRERLEWLRIQAGYVLSEWRAECANQAVQEEIAQYK